MTQASHITQSSLAYLRGFFQAPPADYQNHLVNPLPEKTTLSRAPWIMATLVVVCLVPRAIMAAKITAVCPDGILYIRLAGALGAGDLHAGLSAMHLNTYPVLLLLMHSLGLSWETGGELWGVVISSLVVLPLFGWARRKFDDRVAVVACLLYAFHANMIEWSAELVRGQTFWFLFTLSLYLLWRAITEVRPALFAAAGTAIILTTMTRIEGMFLFIPAVCWCVFRWRALREARGRLVFGAVLCLAAGPVLLLLINFTWLRDHPHWEFARMRPLLLVQTWFESTVLSTSPGTAETGGGLVRPAPQMSLAELLWVYIRTGTRGLTPVFSILMFSGVWAWRRVWARRDTQPLFLVALSVAAGIWIHLWYAQASSYRYPLPLVLMGSVFAAMALLAASARALRFAEERRWSPGLQCIAVAMPMVLVATIGLTDAFTSNCKVQEGRLRLGRWIGAQYGPAPSLIGPQGLGITTGYYAGGSYQSFGNEVGNDELIELARRFQPDLILLAPRQLEAGGGEALIARVRDLGFERVEDSRLPGGPEEVLLFAQHCAASRVARKTARARSDTDRNSLRH